ncbi:MAG: hypothetical protein R3A48_01105 [Polyangiales bacterium]
MRTLRAAFVVTVAATACARPAPPPEEPSRNPPAPDPQPVPPTHPPAMPVGNPPPPSACPPRDQIQVGAACTTGLSCYMPTGGCQPSGFECTEGVWREVTVTCNPPPPPPERAR